MPASAAVNSFPWTGTTPGSAGPYSAAQFAAFFQGLYGRGGPAYAPNAGVAWYSNTSNLTFAITGFGFDVIASTPAAMSVVALQGSAVVNGTFVENVNQPTLTVSSNASGFTRIDTVVLHLDYTAQTATVQVNTGTPSASPVPPTLIQSGLIWEIPLADITVANGAATITQAKIQPRQIPASAPDGDYIPVFNNSGNTLQTGDVVYWDPSASQAVNTSGGVSNTPLTVAGVMVGRTAIGAIGLMLVRGVGYVNTAAAVTAGNMLVGYGALAALPTSVYGSAATYGAFAYALITTAAPGLTPCYIDASNIGLNNANFQKPFNSYFVAAGADYSLSVATTWTEIDTAFRLPVHTSQGRVKLDADFICDMTGGAGDVIFDWYNLTTSSMFNAAGETRAVGTISYPQANIPFHVSAYFTGLGKDTSYTFTLRYFKNSGAMNLRRNGWPIVLTAQDF